MEILEILNIPKIVATVHQSEDLDFLAENDVSETCDLLEFRLDNLTDDLIRAESSIASASLPCIITARHPSEGGAGNLDAAARAALLERFLPHAALIDVEIRSLQELKSVIASARKAEVALIASFHDFEKTPTTDVFQDALDQAFAARADVTKMAFRLESIASLCETLQFFDGFQYLDSINPWRNLSLMGMGSLGKLSRLVFASAGSCLNYGYLNKANAPGQWPAAELKRLILEVSDA